MNRRSRVMCQGCQTPFPAVALKLEFSAAIALNCPVDSENLMWRDWGGRCAHHALPVLTQHNLRHDLLRSTFPF